jgi:hypothetical protein
MNIWIGTSITHNYIKKAMPFLSSINKLHGSNFCVCYGFNPNLLSSKFKNINFYHLERNCMEIEGMIQWGAWLKAIPYNKNDIYIMSDADVIVQRPLNNKEIDRFAEYDANTVGACKNKVKAKYDYLINEAYRISLKEGFSYNSKGQVVNCGVLVAKPDFYIKLTEYVESIMPTFNKFTNFRCRCQFLICHILDKYKFNIDLLSQGFHTNGHFGLPDNCKMIYPGPCGKPIGKLLYDNETVMFKHHFPY